MNFDEITFRESAKREITLCRPGDWKHAVRVVAWVKKLGEGRADLPLIISAAYIHDIGWRNVLTTTEKISLDELRKFESLANSNSKKFSSDFLQRMQYSSEAITTINRLISAADQHKSRTDDEAIIVDADNLSKLTINHLKEKYQRSEWLKIHRIFTETFPQRIKTTAGKTLLPQLLDKCKAAIDKELSLS